MRLVSAAALIVAIPLAAPGARHAQEPASAPAPVGRTRVVVLGSGTPAPDPDRFGPAVVVLVDGTAYLFDAGAGVMRRWAAAQRRGVVPAGATSLRTAFVTHLHSDHTLGYPDLILTGWMIGNRAYRGLDVYGPAGLRSMTDHALAAWAEDVAVRTGEGGELAGRGPPDVRVHEIGPGVVYRDSLVTVTAFAVAHGTWAHAFGYRIQTPDARVVLSGDTRPTRSVVDACDGCDLLLHEGGFRANAEATPYFRAFHTTTEELAEVAAAAHPKLLVLYHQAPESPATARAYALLRSLYFGPFVVARDLDVYPAPR